MCILQIFSPCLLSFHPLHVNFYRMRAFNLILFLNVLILGRKEGKEREKRLVVVLLIDAFIDWFCNWSDQASNLVKYGNSAMSGQWSNHLSYPARAKLYILMRSNVWILLLIVTCFARSMTLCLDLNPEEFILFFF